MTTSAPVLVSSITRRPDPRAVVDRHVCSELERLLQPRVGEVDRDDAPRREELRGHDRREPDRTGTDDRHRVAGLHATVQDADLERGRMMSARKMTSSSDKPLGTL